MATERVINFPRQGEARFWAATGSNYVAMRADDPVTTYTITWPGAAPAGDRFVQMDAAGAISYVSGASGTLNDSYDSGGAGLGRLITADAGAFEVNVTAAAGNAAIVIDQDDDQIGLNITKDGVGAGDAIAVLNSGTGRGLFINQDGDAVALSLDVIATSTADAASILNAGTGRGLFIDQDGAAVGLEIDQDGAAVALSIDQASANFGLEITGGAAAAIKVTAGAAPGLNITQANDNRGVSLTKTGVGAGEALFVENDGTGDGLYVKQDGAGVGINLDLNADGIALDIDVSAASSTDCIDILNAGSGRCFSAAMASASTSVVRFTHNGDNLVFEGNKLGAGTIGCAYLSNAAGSTGYVLLADQNGNGPGIRIDSEATSQPLLSFEPVTGNSRGDIAFPAARTADPSSPADGDIWFNSTASRFKARLTGHTVTFANVLGPAFGPATVATIATGAVSATTEEVGVMVLAAEGAPTTDDLDSILVTGSDEVVEGDTLILRADAGDTITVKHNTGNIHLDASADKALVNGNQLTLIWDGTDWRQLTPMMVLP